MPKFVNPRLHLDVEGEVELAVDVYELVDQALLLAELTGQTVEFDMCAGNKTAHVQVKGDSPRQWIIESIQDVLAREEHDDGWVRPYPDPQIQTLGALAVRGAVEDRPARKGAT